MSSLTVTGLRKSFPAGSGSRARSAPTVAVAGVSLAVQQGSITGVLGPSGCGKTTLLRMVAGFVRPDSGEIRFGDRVVCGPGLFVPPQLRRVGYVPQEGALFPHLTVAANIAFGLPPRDPARDARVSELLDLIELPSAYADRQPRELSGGQQQRVALARALAARPAVVLLDEPFSSLDAGLRTSTGQAVVRALRASGATAVLVTHDQDEALSLTDQVAVMRDGTVIQVDSPRGLYEHPADLDVAHFVGGATLLPRRAVAALLDAVALDGGDEDEMVVIRPEQVMLSTDGTGHPAEVTQTAYYGHDATVHLELSGPSDAGSGPITLVARVVGSAAPEPGARVGVRIAGPVRALPTSPGGRLPI